MSISPAVNIFLLVEKLSRLEKLGSSWHTWFSHIRGLLLVVFALSTMQTMELGATNVHVHCTSILHDPVLRSGS